MVKVILEKSLQSMYLKIQEFRHINLHNNKKYKYIHNIYSIYAIYIVLYM